MHNANWTATQQYPLQPPTLMSASGPASVSRDAEMMGLMLHLGSDLVSAHYLLVTHTSDNSRPSVVEIEG